jgi:hypothetical protein
MQSTQSQSCAQRPAGIDLPAGVEDPDIVSPFYQKFKLMSYLRRYNIYRANARCGTLTFYKALADLPDKGLTERETLRRTRKKD